MDNKDKIIDLNRCFLLQFGHSSKVTMLETALKKAQEGLEKFNKETCDSIMQQLDAGSTTGDPLQDNLVRMFGLNKETIIKVMAFSRELIAGAGLELFITIPYEVTLVCGGERTPDDSRPTHGYIIGILSGQPLKIISKPCFTVILPFSRYIITGFEESSKGAIDGELSLHNPLFESQVSSLMNEIIGLTNMNSSNLSGANRPTIYIGENVFGDKVPDQSSEIEPMRTYLRRMLYAPTQTELALGD